MYYTNGLQCYKIGGAACAVPPKKLSLKIGGNSNVSVSACVIKDGDTISSLSWDTASRTITGIPASAQVHINMSAKPYMYPSGMQITGLEDSSFTAEYSASGLHDASATATITADATALPISRYKYYTASGYLVGNEKYPYDISSYKIYPSSSIPLGMRTSYTAGAFNKEYTAGVLKLDSADSTYSGVSGIYLPRSASGAHTTISASAYISFYPAADAPRTVLFIPHSAGSGAETVTIESETSGPYFARITGYSSLFPSARGRYAPGLSISSTRPYVVDHWTAVAGGTWTASGISY